MGGAGSPHEPPTGNTKARAIDQADGETRTPDPHFTRVVAPVGEIKP